MYVHRDADVMDDIERTVSADIVVEDRQLLLKSISLSKSISQTAQPPSGQVFAPGRPLQEIKNVSLSIGQKAVAAQARLGIPVLRYTCIDQFRPILFKVAIVLKFGCYVITRSDYCCCASTGA